MIVGRLIPAGTGSFYHLNRRRRPEDVLADGFVDAPAEAPAGEFSAASPDEAGVPAE